MASQGVAGGSALPDRTPIASRSAAGSQQRGSLLVDVAPWSGFAAAADAALDVLRRNVGLDLWMVLQRRGDQQVVVAVRGGWAPIPTGAVFPWAESFCRHMVAGQAPRIAPRCEEIPAYAAVAANRRVRVQAYVGMPIVDADGGLFGTVCGFAAEPCGDRLYEQRPLLESMTRLLSTLLVKEQAAAERSQAAAEAYARIDRDPVTGVLNWRGWQRTLDMEQDRQLRYGGSVSLVAIELRTGRVEDSATGAATTEPVDQDVVRRAADVITSCCRPSDTVARAADRVLAVLAPYCPPEQAVTLAYRLVEQLAGAEVDCRINYLTCPAGNDLVAAWADGALSERCAAPAGPPRQRGGVPALDDGLAEPREAGELPGAGDDAGFRRRFLPLRDGCLRALHAAGLDHSQLAALSMASVQFAPAGVLVVLPGRDGVPGGRILLPDPVGSAGPAVAVTSVRTYYQTLLGRLTTTLQHPVAPPPLRWPLFPLISPAGKLSPVGLSARHLGRLLYGRSED
jgi:GGDEF domain-containing protein